MGRWRIAFPLPPVLSLLLLGACVAPPPGGPFCATRSLAVLPAELRQNAVLVPARINGVPVRMEVDTGAMTTLISANAAIQLGLPPDPDRGARLYGTGGVIVTRNALVESFEFGGVASPPRSIPTGPLARVFASGTGMDPVEEPVAGIVGVPDLAQFDVELDALNQRMTLWSVSGCAGRFVSWNEPHHVIPLTADTGGLLYATVLVNGQPLRAMIDWGARSSQITARAAGRIGVTEDMLAGDPISVGRGIDQTVIPLRHHRFEEVRVGPELFRNLRISVGDLRLRNADMLLGMDYARTRRLWLSYATSQMFVAPRRSGALPPIAVAGAPAVAPTGAPADLPAGARDAVDALPNR